MLVLKFSEEMHLNPTHIVGFSITPSAITITMVTGEKHTLEGQQKLIFENWLYNVVPAGSIIDLPALFANRTKFYEFPTTKHSISR